jgi:hypothetical protein
LKLHLPFVAKREYGGVVLGIVEILSVKIATAATRINANRTSPGCAGAVEDPASSLRSVLSLRSHSSATGSREPKMSQQKHDVEDVVMCRLLLRRLAPRAASRCAQAMVSRVVA